MRFHLKIEIITILIFLAGCGTGETLIMENKIRTEKHDGYEIIFDYDKKGSSAVKASERSFHYYQTKREFANKGIKGPAQSITSMGIKEAICGNYIEAEFLFSETENLLTDGSPQNNLAVVYEASGSYDEAFTMYSKALLVSPDNKIFQGNFFLFLNQNYNKRKEPDKKKRR